MIPHAAIVDVLLFRRKTLYRFGTKLPAMCKSLQEFETLYVAF